jgi:hypothetical protein
MNCRSLLRFLRRHFVDDKLEILTSGALVNGTYIQLELPLLIVIHTTLLLYVPGPSCQHVKIPISQTCGLALPTVGGASATRGSVTC